MSSTATAEKVSLITHQSGAIDDVKVVDLTMHLDDRGYLYEIIHRTDPYIAKFGQVYLVGNMTRGTIRAFHKHEKLWDYFCIVHGSAKFALVDDRPDSSTYGNIRTIVLNSKKPQMIVVPPGVHHGWMGLEDDTILVSVGSEVYNKDNPDEERVPFDSFGYDWSVKFK
ncbi:dTDP-4-dehydrorhamnose 3,5-epimerase family protein [Candidatus Berkelbacteria bacterium]|nr:dTDP-4-dehydrorhamnose 3,5-epimerase family protein [Candidatus Berkelbacteria bacterium]